MASDEKDTASNRAHSGHTALTINLLDTISISIGKQTFPITSSPGRQLLLLLCLSKNYSVQRKFAAQTIWPDRDSAKSSASLRQAIHHLRSILPTLYRWTIHSDRQLVRLEKTAVRIDLEGCIEDIASGSDLQLDHLPAMDTLFADSADVSDLFEEWVSSKRIETTKTITDALHTRLRLESRGPNRQRIAKKLSQLDPADEVACREQMTFAIDSGNISGALSVYSNLWSYLSEKLDVEPSESTQKLALKIKLGLDNLDQSNSSLQTDASTEVDYPPTRLLVNPQGYSIVFLINSELDQASISKAPISELVDSLKNSINQKYKPERSVSSGDSTQGLLAVSCMEFFQALEIAREANAIFRSWKEIWDSSKLACRSVVCDRRDFPINSNISIPKDYVASLRPAIDLLDNAQTALIGTAANFAAGQNLEDIEDLSVSTSPHIAAYRLVESTSPTPRVAQLNNSVLELPTIAILPFHELSKEPGAGLVGEILANELTAVMSRSNEINVISSLSAKYFFSTHLADGLPISALNATYVVQGVYRNSQSKIVLDMNLLLAHTNETIWTERITESFDGFMEPTNRILLTVARHILTKLKSTEIKSMRSTPLKSLSNYTILSSAISLMHGLSTRSFTESHTLLKTLIDREPNNATPRAWLAKWYVLRVQQGWSSDIPSDGSKAIQQTNTALDLDPFFSLAHTVAGFVHTNIYRDLEKGIEYYRTALDHNPNESLALALKGALHAFSGEGDKALFHTEKALHITPLDPLKYLYESLAASAALTAGNYQLAHTYAQKSLKLNRSHTSTLRVLAISQCLLGHDTEAQNTVYDLLKVEPDFTVDRWRKRSPGADPALLELLGNALNRSGVPLN